MSNTGPTNGMNCEAFVSTLSAYLERELDTTARARMEAHAAECADCAALLADLQQISADAAALPTFEPSRDLWEGIAARIEAPVIPLAAGAHVAAAPSRRWRPAIAAAALILVTSGVTYLATMQSMRGSLVGRMPPATVVASTPDDPATEFTRIREQASVVQRDSLAVVMNAGPDSPAFRERLQRSVQRSVGTQRDLALVEAARSTSEADLAAASLDSLYGLEIVRLRAIIAGRSAVLDPATIAIIDQNLGIIDSAIVRSRAALQRDPASGFLNEQLTSALQRKVELLRTAATLPARS